MTTPTPEDIRAQYGFVAMLAGAIPEIGGLMQQAVDQKWTIDRFRMALANTGWWKNTDPANREWLAQQYGDPAGATAALRNGGAQVASEAAKLGFFGNVFNAQEAEQAWLYARLHGFDEAQTRAHIISIAGPRSVGLPLIGGEFGKWMTDFRTLAANYGFSTDETERRLRQSVPLWQGGTADLARFQQEMRSYAKSKYAAFADRIEAGETVRDIAQPYIDVYAQTLELNPQDIGLNDQYVQRWLQGRSEPGKPPVSVPVWQAQQELRKDQRWGYTQNARNAAAEVATTIGRAFGFIG